MLVDVGKYEVQQFPRPRLVEGACLVRNIMSGVCGTDKHTFQGFVGQYSGALAPSSTPFPIIQGHENVGEVVEVRGELTDYEGHPIRPGDRVVVGPNVTCRGCFEERHNYPYTLCPHIEDYGNTMSARQPPHLFGGWAEHMYVKPGSFIFKVPDDLPSDVAVLTEVFAVTAGLDRAAAMGGFPYSGFGFDDTVVVYGVGPLGLCHVVKARMMGAGTIVAVDLSPARLDFALELGADAVINASETEPAERVGLVQALTRGRGADVVVECAGVPEVIPLAIDLLRPGGTFVEVGNFSDLGEVAISPHRHLCSKGIRLIGIPGQEAQAYGPSMRQMSRHLHRFPWEGFVSHRFSLDAAKAAVERAVDPDSIKVVIDPWLDG